MQPIYHTLIKDEELPAKINLGVLKGEIVPTSTMYMKTVLVQITSLPQRRHSQDCQCCTHSKDAPRPPPGDGDGDGTRPNWAR